MEDSNSKNIQLQYQGYLNTPLLWENQDVLGLHQLELSNENTKRFNESIPENLRLGKRVERFVHAELVQQDNIDILLENVQIQNQKITVGEIDCLMNYNDNPIHLEIVYKFYLYDSNVGKTEIDHWIGPNRNDSLLKKLNKLKTKQLPLIRNKHTQPVLESLNLNIDNIDQRVLFKAQLFIPYKTKVDFELLNKNCLTGFFINHNKIDQFSHCKFYIPSKTNWLLEVQSKVDWLLYASFYERIIVLISEKRSALCWIKFPNGNIQKLFVVWWD